MTIDITEREHVKDIELSGIQKVSIAMFLLFMGWMGATVYSMSITSAVVQSQVEMLVKQNTDSYSNKQAIVDKEVINGRMNTMEKNIERLEGKHGL